MDRRKFITLTAPAIGAVAGCVGTDRNAEGEGGGDDSGDPEQTHDQDTHEPVEDDESESESESEPEPEPEGGDGEPYYHYDLDVRETRERGHPLWIDQHERVYGRDGLSVLVSDDWWQSAEALYTFENERGRVENVVVPRGANPIVSVGGQETDDGGRVYRLTGARDDPSGHDLVYQFDYGRSSNSLGHVVDGEIVLLSTYELSQYEAGKNANEVICSTDSGRSFERILAVPLNTTDAANLHIHDVEWDPYAERIWVAVGDHGNSQLYWSDDLGNSWEEIDDRGDMTMVTQIVAFKDCVTLGTDGTPEGIMRWEREGADDEPGGTSDFERVHVEIQTDDDEMSMYARRRWHIREDLEEGRELCLMPFGYSPMNDTAEDSVVLASVDGDEWYELHRTETRDILLTNVMGPLSMDADGERRVLVSDSNQGAGYQIDATVPAFWE